MYPDEIHSAMVRIGRFDWDDSNAEHIQRHGVEPTEAEEVLRHQPQVRGGRQGTYLAWGRTAVGRYLLVVFVRRRKGLLRVVTARDMSAREKQRYRGGQR